LPTVCILVVDPNIGGTPSNINVIYENVAPDSRGGKIKSKTKCLFNRTTVRYDTIPYNCTALQHLWGHVTSSVTWPFDTPYVISYWWFFETESLNPAVFEILRSFALYVLANWRHRLRDHLMAHMPFPIGGPLEPSLYL